MNFSIEFLIFFIMAFEIYTKFYISLVHFFLLEMSKEVHISCVNNTAGARVSKTGFIHDYLQFFTAQPE